MTPKDILTNPYFCPMPWSGLMYNFNGSVKNCIRSAGSIGNISNDPIEKILLGDKNIDNQNNIVQKHPVANCHTCYDLERNKKGMDIISDRIFYIKEFKKTPPDTYVPGNFNLKTIDVRWTNLCNFACVYCGPMFSSRWAEELKFYPQMPSLQQLEDFTNYLYQHADKLEHVYLAGGEPLLMKQNLELLKRLNPKVNLRINTNLSKTETDVFEKICEFKNVHWTVSVETMQEEFEYVRYGGNWSDFLENLVKIQRLGHKITFNMLWLLLNYESIFDCVNYLKSLGFHNNSFVIGALLDPEYLNIRHLPDNVLQLLQDKLKWQIDQSPGYLLEDSYKNMLYYIQQPFQKNLLGSFEQLKKLDQQRGLNSQNIFKNLYNLHKEN